MHIGQWFRRPFRGARLLRSILRQQERHTRALERQTEILEAIGRLYAQSRGQPWATVQRPLEVSTADLSSVGAPDDEFFAATEAIRADYQARFGREVTDEEVLAVYADHRHATN